MNCCYAPNPEMRVASAALLTLVPEHPDPHDAYPLLQTNELRKINTVLTTDIQQFENHDRAASDISLAALLGDGEEVLSGGGSAGGSPVLHTAQRGGRDRVPFRAAGNSIISALRLGRKQQGNAALNPPVVERAREMNQWVIQHPSDEEQKSCDDGGSQVEKGRVMAHLWAHGHFLLT